MAENDGQERTEDATPRRREQAREKGQVPRSRELASVAVLVLGSVALMWFGGGLGEALLEVMRKFFSLTRDEIFDVTSLGNIIYGAIFHLVLPLMLILMMLLWRDWWSCSLGWRILFVGSRATKTIEDESASGHQAHVW